MTARVWIDVEDLFIYAAAGHRPSGIQRLEFELCRALVGLRPDRISFVRHARGQRLRAIPWEDVEALMDEMSSRESKKAGECPSSDPIRRKHSIKKTLASLVPRRIRKLVRRRLDALRPLAEEPSSADDFAARPGEILAAFGSPWISDDYHSHDQKAVCEKGLRFAMLVYDLIPLRRPDWFGGDGTTNRFQAWFEDAVQRADVILTISAATAADVSVYARNARLALGTSPAPIPIGTGFTTGRQNIAPAKSIRLPPPDSYALFVSTIEARKNHALLVRVWQLMLENMPPESIPTLVFAGRVGWLVSDLMQQLRNSNFLGSKIVHIESPTDEELETLYGGCLFTLYPSFFEVWGLPVTESHAFGRPCIASKATSLPEAGGSLARYIDPDNATDAYRIIRETIEDRAALATWRDRVRNEFRPVEWSQSAQAVLEALDGVETDIQAADRPVCPLCDHQLCKTV